ncbi:sugar phosphate isomerase/epimerase family protein [Rubritalea spongiae]|uniref:sugar phosphate isomerase/epimerase family protein n=1 Tax=Rubritalea spongiae TaxID=430797 RepID=UPI00366B6822
MAELTDWARANRFAGIEMWGGHARSLKHREIYDADWLKAKGMYVSMLSDYIDFTKCEADFLSAAEELLEMTTNWNCKKLRVFAGSKGSDVMPFHERVQLVIYLKQLCALAEARGIYVLVETHPNTFADSLRSTQWLLDEVGHDHLRLNFDVLHVWESGADPVEAFHKLEAQIMHVHLKNVSERSKLGVFAPGNVYSASGSREGMVSLFDGELDFQHFFDACDLEHLDASLEWFGRDIYAVLASDAAKLASLRGLARC